MGTAIEEIEAGKVSLKHDVFYIKSTRINQYYQIKVVEENNFHWKVVNGKLHVRSHPCLQSEVVDVLLNGSIIVGERHGDWIKHKLGWSCICMANNTFLIPEKAKVDKEIKIDGTYRPLTQVLRMMRSVCQIRGKDLLSTQG